MFYLDDINPEVIDNVKLFNKTAKLFVGDLQSTLKQEKQFAEEMDEMFAAEDPLEVVDAAGDMAFVIVSLELLNEDNHNIRIYKEMLHTICNALVLDQNTVLTALDIIAKSNLTKFDLTLESADKTKDYYTALGIPTKVVRFEHVTDSGTTIYYITQVEEDTTTEDGKFYFKDKILKSVELYTEPDLISLADEYTEVVANEIQKLSE